MKKQITFSFFALLVSTSAYAKHSNWEDARQLITGNVIEQGSTDLKIQAGSSTLKLDTNRICSSVSEADKKVLLITIENMSTNVEITWQGNLASGCIVDFKNIYKY
jgi:hypothetical protein